MAGTQNGESPDGVVKYGMSLKAFFTQCFSRLRAMFASARKQAPYEGPEYVVVDLEWNQYPRWMRTPVSASGVVMPHEIIQIGAVKVTQDFRVLDTFSVGVRLPGRRKLSKHVARVIQKTQADIDRGLDFPVAYQMFTDWCGGAERFITWGGDDLRVLQRNLAFYRLPAQNPAQWFDAQLIYARQILGSRIQTALAKAAETLGVEDGLTHHDALNDAYITVGVCAKLDMQSGMEKLAEPPKPKRTENRLFLQKKFISAGSEGGFETRALARQHCTAAPVCCPECGMVMKLEPKRVSSGDKWMRMGVCRVHGRHLVRYRVRHKGDNQFAWTRTVYAPDEELSKYFDDKAADSKTRRRGGRGRGKKPASGQQNAATARRQAASEA